MTGEHTGTGRKPMRRFIQQRLAGSSTIGEARYEYREVEEVGGMAASGDVAYRFRPHQTRPEAQDGTWAGTGWATAAEFAQWAADAVEPGPQIRCYGCGETSAADGWRVASARAPAMFRPLGAPPPSPPLVACPTCGTVKAVLS